MPASKVRHGLVCGGNAPPGGVVVSSKVRPGAAPARRSNQSKKVHLAALIEDRLRSFDHQFDAQCSWFQSKHRLEARADVGKRRDFIRQHHLGQSDEKILGQGAARLFRQFREENVQGANASAAKFLVVWVDANADALRQLAGI